MSGAAVDDVTSTGGKQLASELVRLVGKSIETTGEVTGAIEKSDEQAKEIASETNAKLDKLIDVVNHSTESQDRLTETVQGLVTALVERIPAAADQEAVNEESKARVENQQAQTALFVQIAKALGWLAAGGAGTYGASQWLGQ